MLNSLLERGKFILKMSNILMLLTNICMLDKINSINHTVVRFSISITIYVMVHTEN